MSSLPTLRPELVASDFSFPAAGSQWVKCIVALSRARIWILVGYLAVNKEIPWYHPQRMWAFRVAAIGVRSCHDSPFLAATTIGRGFQLSSYWSWPPRGRWEDQETTLRPVHANCLPKKNRDTRGAKDSARRHDSCGPTINQLSEKRRVGKISRNSTAI